MTTAGLSGEQIVQRGKEIYERQIRPLVEPVHKGKFPVIDVKTGGYEMDADAVAAAKRAKARFPIAPRFTMRVGYPAAYRMGGRADNRAT
jgi:hypothetical protein